MQSMDISRPRYKQCLTPQRPPNQESAESTLVGGQETTRPVGDLHMVRVSGSSLLQRCDTFGSIRILLAGWQDGHVACINNCANCSQWLQPIGTVV